MKFFQLLHQREALLRSARLANLAFAYHRLGEFATRIAHARLRGPARLLPADPANGRPWPVLEPEAASRAVVEEHFLEEDLVELTDILGYVSEPEISSERGFRFEEIEARFLPGLRDELKQAGVSLDHEATPSVEDSNRGTG